MKETVDKKPLKVGKLENKVLKEIVLDSITYRNPDVITRAAVGEDCATISFGEYNCVMSTDPITAAVSEIGKIAIHITCNDIASNGVRPLGIMLAVMLPEGTTTEDIHFIMKQAGETAEKMKVEIIGGHTEITPSVNKPVIVSTAIGKSCDTESRRTPQENDVIIMTKYAGMEGTGIIASDLEEQIKEVCSEDEIKEAKELLEDISVIEDGVIAWENGAIAMHDVTEGGILGAVWEMCEKDDVGCTLDVDKIPVSDVTLTICENFNIEYLKLISSGCMLIISPEENKEEIITGLENRSIKATEIGKIQDKKFGIMMAEKGKSNVYKVIEPPSSDELYKVF